MSSDSAYFQRRAAPKRIRGNLPTFSDQQLREACRRRGISSRGDRQELDDRIISYNQRKQSEQSSHEDPGWLNTGLPTPDDRLGPPTDNRVLGTRDSDVYHGQYSQYLTGYGRQQHHGGRMDSPVLAVAEQSGAGFRLNEYRRRQRGHLARFEIYMYRSHPEMRSIS